MPRALTLCYLMCALTACSDSSDDERRQAPAPLVEEPQEAAPRLPGYPLIDDSVLRRAPDLLDHLVPRLNPATGLRFRNLVYEANNVDLRGGRTEQELYEDTGVEIAERWREGAAGVRGVLVLRDALFSQQDHPIDHNPVSIMMPASWISVAVHEVMEGRELHPANAPELDDDAAWAELDTPALLFGSFPPSERLHEEATKPRSVLAPQRLLVTNARRSVAMLAEQSRAMCDAAAEGPVAVAAAGAEAISLSDRRYFGERLRRENIILVTVENPTLHERVDEAKGFRPPRGTLSDEAVATAVNALYRRRLEDGDVGIERVDVNRMSERRHAVDLLERLIPEEAPGESQIWLYVHGGMRGSAIDDALSHMYGFRLQLEAGNVNLSRLRVFARPPVPIGGSDLARQLWLSSRRFRNHDLPMSLNLGSGLLSRLFEELRPTLQRRMEINE
ncbi:MAG: hypothetical protein ACI9KE_001906 [Polyangiales bacterium]|jgi:hypothetical protein